MNPWTDPIRRALQRGDASLAERLLSAAAPAHQGGASWLALSALERHLAGDVEAAIDAASRAIRVDPGEAMAAAFLAGTLPERGRSGEAIAIAQACLAVSPDAAHVHRLLAAALLFRGDAPAAVAQADQAVALLPHHAACIGMALFASLYDDRLDPATRQVRHRALGRTIVPVAASVPLRPAAGRRLRVGWYSADFSRHPVGALLLPVLEQLDRSRFDVVCYAHLGSSDDITERYRALPIDWHAVADLDDAQLLDRMRADRLDVLVDLAGHSRGGRPALVRGRAAPAQLAWLGYPFDSGLPEIDAVVGDDVLYPPDEATATPVLRHPDGWFCLQPIDDLPPVAPLPLLATGRPTLGCFNHLAKLSEATLDLWSHLLHHCASARLVLCAAGLADASVQDFTRERFQRRGIDAARLDLRPPQPAGPAFLRQYADIDLALDPLAFSGGATTLDALRQGVPVVTRAGRASHQRLSASLLRRVGLDALVAADDAAYVACVAGLLAQPQDLAALRASLRTRLARAPATDVDRYTRGVETLLLRAAGRC